MAWRTVDGRVEFQARDGRSTAAEDLRSGALPGKSREEQERYLAREGRGITPAQAKRVVDEILAEEPPPVPKPGRPSGIRPGYGDPRPMG